MPRKFFVERTQIEPKKFEFDAPYPPHYSYLEDLTREARVQMQHMNEALGKLPNREVVTVPDRPGEEESNFVKRRFMVSELIGYALEDAKYAYRRSIIEWVSKKVCHEDPKIKSWILRSASLDMDTYPEPKAFRDRNINVREEAPQKDEMLANMDEARPENRDNQEPSLSKRYLMGLSQTKANGLTDRIITPSRDPEPDKS